MPVILTLILSFFLLGCSVLKQPDSANSTTETTKVDKNALPISPQVSMLENRTAYKEDKSIAPNISGAYELETGTDHHKTVSNAYMVIEKLDDLNYGYYYAVQDEKATANGFFGIFRYREGTFLNKVLDEGNVTTLNHNITLITEGQRLKLIVIGSFGKRTIIWSRVLEDNKTENKVLSEALADAKISYTQIYKDKFDTFTEKEGN
jgi:hypothetical protein